MNYSKYINEVKNRVEIAIKNGQKILGPELHNFEREIADYYNVKYAIGVNSCTDALIYALKTLEVSNGDEVICPVFTFVATAEVIIWAGGRPVFVDIEPESLNIKPDFIRKSITEKTKVIIPVHLYGQSANMKEISKIARDYKLKIVEDAAQSFGSEYYGKKVGTMGHLGCLSFFPSKILSAFGDGGMILTNNLRLAKQLTRMRIHGADNVSKMYHEHRIIGGASRLHELQASILRVGFEYLGENLKHRRKIAEKYNTRLRGVGDLVLPTETKNIRHVYNSYIIRTSFRDQLKSFLEKNGIKTNIFYPKPLHLLSAFRFLGYKAGDFPNAENAAKQVLALPINQFLSLTKAMKVIKITRKFFDIAS